MNEITANIPGESEIADQLEDIREADRNSGGDGDASIIEWALEHHAKDLKPWAYFDTKGEIQGEFARLFAQAIRIEGTKRSQGKHPAGVVISQEPLHEVCPMVYDKNSGEMIAGMEMDDLESAGHVKFDILGLAMLDKVHGVIDMLKTGETINGS
jgi:error-prone DNA polymerase